MSDTSRMALYEWVYDHEHKGRPPEPYQPRCTVGACGWQGKPEKSLKAAQNAFTAHYTEVHG